MKPPTSKSVILPLKSKIVSFGATPHFHAEAEKIRAFVGDEGLVVDLRNEKDKKPDYYDHKWDIAYISYPIVDGRTPDNFKDVKRLLKKVSKYERIYIHCRGGHGRAGLISALLCLHLKECETWKEALDKVYNAHQTRVTIDSKFKKMGSPQTREQKTYVVKYYNYMNKLPEDVMFYDIKGEYGEFSNFWSKTEHQRKYKKTFNLFIDGEEWDSTEQYFQAQKFTCPPPGKEGVYKEYVNIIRAADTQTKVFKLSRQRASGYAYSWRLNKYDHRKIGDIIKKYKDLVFMRGDWDTHRLVVMKKALDAKFSQNPELKDLLLSTKEMDIYEDSPYDSFWGIGRNRNGENKLGLMLTSLRSEI